LRDGALLTGDISHILVGFRHIVRQSCREKLGIFAEFVLEVALSRNFQYVRHKTWFLDYYLIIFLAWTS